MRFRRSRFRARVRRRGRAGRVRGRRMSSALPMRQRVGRRF